MSSEGYYERIIKFNTTNQNLENLINLYENHEYK